jgi:leucyl aminopeptidase (aminopeptidase T)
VYLDCREADTMKSYRTTKCTAVARSHDAAYTPSYLFRGFQLFAVLIVLMWVHVPVIAADDETAGADWSRISAAIFERMSLQPGEKVLLIAEPGRFDPLTLKLGEKVSSAGAVDLGVVRADGEEFAGPTSTAFSRKLRGLAGSRLRQALQEVDLALVMPGPTAADPVYAAMQDNLRMAQPGDGARMIHFHWEGAYGLDGTLFPPDERVDAVYRKALLETDYRQLAEVHKEFELAMRGAPVRVTTPAGTDIVFEIGGRPVTRQDGDASAARARSARNLIDREVELPAGVVRVAPIEETVSGRIAFPDTAWNGQAVTGLILTFERGHVVTIEAQEGREAVMAEIQAAGSAGRAFREFALGFNPLLAVPEHQPWIPYYGYGDGVVRLSLGDNTELGGDVGGGYVRWNFFTDASVYVGEDAWVLGGRLVPRSQ